MAGHGGPGITFAHAGSDQHAGLGAQPAGFDRQAREGLEAAQLAPGATRGSGAGERSRPEDADPWRTCFERDRDRILHATAFRRLAGKTQVFVFPDDHQRTRLTHALEVAQVAGSIARACRLNVALTEAIALGHDCGHGPGGHASEDALSRTSTAASTMPPGCGCLVGAPQSLRRDPRRIRNHSWSRPAPSTPRGRWSAGPTGSPTSAMTSRTR